MPDVAPMLQPAVDRSDGHWTVWDVIAAILQGHMFLWLSVRDGKPEACAVTRIIDYPRMRVCSVPFVGGKARQNWLHFERDIAEWGRSMGCKEIESYVRKGWLRVLKDWIPSFTYIRKPI